VVDIEEDPTTAGLVRAAHGAAAALGFQKGLVLLFGELVFRANGPVRMELSVFRVAAALLFIVSVTDPSDLLSGSISIKTWPTRFLPGHAVGRVSSRGSRASLGVLLTRARAGRGSLGHIDSYTVGHAPGVLAHSPGFYVIILSRIGANSCLFGHSWLTRSATGSRSL
jgi:hypothetical protein